MIIAVTAASGHLGGLICAELADSVGDDRVVAIARDTADIDVSVDKRRGDYLERDIWPDILTGVDTLVLVSSPVGPWDRIQMHRNVIAGAQRAGVRKLLYTSVIGNGKESETRYADVAHVNRQTEQDVRASGLDWAIPRNGLYLEFDVAHIVNAGQTGGIFRNNGGSGRCGYITRTELAAATARMALDDHCSGNIYNLVADCRSQAELVDIVNEVCGTRVRYEAISDDEHFAALAKKRGEMVANMLTGCYQCIRKGAFDVTSDFEAAAGRPPLSVRQQIEQLHS